MTDYRLFNVFGMLRVEQQHVSALATAILESGRSVEKTLSRDLNTPIAELAEGETAVLLFAALIAQGSRPQIAVQQLGRRTGGPDVLGNKVIREILNEVVSLIEI